MKKLIPFSLVAIVTLISFNPSARADFASTAAACVGVGTVTGAAAYAKSRGQPGPTVLMAGAGCVSAGMIVGAATANAEEAPAETELKADDLKTLQDAKDLQNE